jgi:hypothetical protein
MPGSLAQCQLLLQVSLKIVLPGQPVEGEESGEMSRWSYLPWAENAVESWCAREDLNLHPLRDQILSLACLPFHHSRDLPTKMPLPRPRLKPLLACQAGCLFVQFLHEQGITTLT